MRLGAWSLWLELIAVLLITIVASNGLTFALVWTQWSDRARHEQLGDIEERLAALVPLLLHLPESQWDRLLTVASVRHEVVSIDATPAVALDAPRDLRAEGRLREVLAIPQVAAEPRELRVSRRAKLGLTALGDRRRRGYVGMDVAVPLVQGRWLNAKFRWPDEDNLLPGLAGSAAITAIAVCLAAIWLAGRLAWPLRQLEAASRDMQSGRMVPRLAAAGPSVVRRTIHAFNEMAQRLMPIVDGQRVVLASVGHDLRSPIASLRIKSELIDDEVLKQEFSGSLDELQSMTEAALEAARSGLSGEEMRPIDLVALADSVCDDLAAQGHDATCDARAPLVVTCRPNEIRRALRNLVENAIKYGRVARARVFRANGHAVVSIEDDGPGIAEADLQRVFEPFVRLANAGAGLVPGHGLGLAITRTIARAHGGDVVLSNRPDGGLRVTLTLRN